ncbi:TPR repeat-containing protein-like protein [Calocera cornea HHB12733]|uniref:TPR repeat-containing protein-like protein n=1 Tax=Calocera cornea HHB12733 TaxID=1353952 RepID=A0A165CYC6_9BASI|nr:TPR repeat-containing protein-like protein [Calocera cornea HHB12733]
MPTTIATTAAPAGPELRVIGAGLGRTGTSSMKEALEILGFGPCHHMSELTGKVGRCWEFVAAYHGKPTDWREMMAGWVSTVDTPTTDFVPELMAAYPDAKVILTVRDNSTVWWKSYTDTIMSVMTLWNGVLIYPFPAVFAMWSVGRNAESSKRRQYGVVGPACYEAHNARIKAIVPKEKLLVFNVKEGWEPLCNFLVVEVPNVPFPRKNETKELQKGYLIMRTVAAAVWMLGLGLVALIVQQVAQRGGNRDLDLRKPLHEL